MNYKSILLLLSFVLFISCGGASDRSTDAAVVAVHSLEVDTVTLHVDYPAYIDAATDIEIRPQVEGFLVKLFVDEGNRVKKGDSLFQIDPRIYSQRLAEARSMREVAESQFKKASIELKNGDELLRSKIISPVQYEVLQADFSLAKANLSQAKAALERTQIELEFATVKAPVNGVIGKINYRDGALVSPSTPLPLTTLSDIETIRAYFSIGEHQYLDMVSNRTIKIDSTQVQFVLANGEPFSELGIIDVLNGKFSSSGGSILMRATFANPNYLLRTGNTGKVRIEKEEKDVLTVPKRMTMRIQNKTHLYLVKEAKLSLRAIEVDEGTPDTYIIRSGAERGDIILAAGLQMAYDGMSVKTE